MRDRPLYSSGFFCYRKYPYSSFFERLRRKPEENRSGKRPILRNRPFCNDYTDKMEKSDGVNEIFGLITEKTGRIAAVTGHYSPQNEKKTGLRRISEGRCKSSTLRRIRRMLHQAGTQNRQQDIGCPLYERFLLHLKSFYSIIRYVDYIINI